MSIWIRLAVFLLGHVSAPITEALHKLFDTLEEKAKASENKLDDYAVGLARFVILGEYTSSESGQMESVVETLLGKMSEPLRELFHQGLLGLQKLAATTTTPFDDIAVKLLLNVLFPTPGSSVAVATVIPAGAQESQR